MALPSDYISGTITLTNGSTAFTGTGTGWLAADFREGDIILDVEGGEGAVAVIASITSNTAGVLSKEWEGPTLTGVAYRMRYQWDSGRVSAQSRAAIEMLGNGNLQSFASITGPGVPVFDGPHSVTIKPESEFVNGVAYDVQIDTLADRDAYDGQSEGFAVLVSDMGDGRSALYSKESNTVGDWGAPAYVTGPIGPLPEVEATVDLLPPGSTPTVTPTPITGGVRLDFELPEASGFYNAGVYDIGEAYDQDDVVQYNGSSFIALQAVPAGESPSNAMPPVDTAYWQVLAVKGQDGTGTGDVVGPSGAVTNRVAVFDGTTGKILKDGGKTIAEIIPSTPHLSGLNTAPGVFFTYGFQVAPGQCSPINGDPPIKIATAIEKAFNFGWAPGNNQGGFDGAAASVSAPLVANTTYFMYVIAKAGGVDPETLTSTSPTAPTMPTGYTLWRRIGWMKTDASGVPRPWRQDGGWFKMLNSFEIAAGTVSVTSTAQNVLLDGPVGIKTIADFAAFFTGTSLSAFGSVCDPDVGPATITDAVIYAPTGGGVVQAQVWTDSLCRVSVASNNASSFRAFIRGFYDMRDTFV